MKGNRRYWDVQVSPIMGTDGKPERILSISRDITDLKAAEESARRAGPGTGPPHEELARHGPGHRHPDAAPGEDDGGGPHGRGPALVRPGSGADILTRSNFTEADINEVVAAAIEPHRVAEDRISWSGPHLILTSQQALGLSLAVHELATNAAKYGALSNEAGRVTMAWRVEAGMFAFDWVEAGGPPSSRRAAAASARS